MDNADFQNRQAQPAALHGRLGQTVTDTAGNEPQTVLRRLRAVIALFRQQCPGAGQSVMQEAVNRNCRHGARFVHDNAAGVGGEFTGVGNLLYGADGNQGAGHHQLADTAHNDRAAKFLREAEGIAGHFPGLLCGGGS
ncbi:hypothetical protein SDC9_194816 [bioreactor metagenome]|uniref:Uncharacterized protein n=1 Tax=bioreactor metagenome TaxID=1076179 RepID=A0A645I7B2_9ZZZZ